MKFRIPIPATLAGLLALCATALPALDLRKDLTVHKLDNGMTVLIYPRHNVPVFAAVLCMNVGSVDEPNGETGVAHMFEHMAFKGSETIGTTDFAAELPIMEKMDDLADEAVAELSRHTPDQKRLGEIRDGIRALQEEQSKFVVKDEFDGITAGAGASGMNASTAADFTTYYINMPSNKLEMYLWLESDRLKHPFLREFYSERDVVVEERRQRTDDSAMGRMYESFLTTMFRAHPYGNPGIGWPSDIGYLTARGARRFHEKYYGPPTATLAIVGDVDPTETIALCERYFGDWDAPGHPHRVTTKEPPIEGERRVQVLFDAEPSLMMGWLKPTSPHPDDAAFEILTSVLSEERLGRLDKVLVEDRQLATRAFCGSLPGVKYDNAFMIQATPRAPHTVAECESAIEEVLADIAANGVTDREVQRAVNNTEALTVRAARGNESLAEQLAQGFAATGNPYELEDAVERLRKVTPADVQRVVAQYLKKDRRAVVWLDRPAAAAAEGAAK